MTAAMTVTPPAEANVYTTAEAAKVLGKKTTGAITHLARAHNIGRRMGRDWLFTAYDLQRLSGHIGAGRRVKGDPGQPRPPRENRLPSKAKRPPEPTPPPPPTAWPLVGLDDLDGNV